MILDAMAARLAAERADHSAIEHLRKLVGSPVDPKIGFAENARKMLEVRLAIANATQNPALALFMQALNDALVSKLGLIKDPSGQFKADQKRTHLGNRELVEAIVAGDPGRAERQVVRDFELRRNSVSQLDVLLREATRTPNRRLAHELLTERDGDKKAAEITAAKIADDIRVKGWKEGTPLGPEVTLQERYGVSRAVFREAVRFLEMHQVVRTKSGAHGGLVIDSPDPRYTVRCVVAYLRHLSMRTRDLWEIQSVLEINAAELAATRASADDVKRMEGILAGMLSAGADDALGASANLHILIAETTKNRALALFLQVLIQIGRETLPSIEARTMPWLERAHRRLVAAIASGDSGMARRRMIEVFTESGRWVRTAPNY
jgi:DNA-binding FadR family transcriptional regulator